MYTDLLRLNACILADIPGSSPANITIQFQFLWQAYNLAETEMKAYLKQLLKSRCPQQYSVKFQPSLELGNINSSKLN